MGKGSLFEVGDNVEFARVLLHLSIVVVFIVILEKLLHKLQHGLKRYPKYHEMLTKVFGELMILGFISLCIKLLKEVAELDSYNPSLIAFQAADLAVFILAIALILQSICVYLRLRAKNILWDKAELLGSEALLAIIQEHKESASTTAPQATKKSSQSVRPQDFFELVQMRLIRHYFLQKMDLPELFPFAKYLRQAQENQITHMIEVKVTTWIMLLALAWVMHLIAIVVGEKDDMSESEALVPAFAAFSWLTLFVHIAIHQYFERAIRHLLTTATHFTGRSQWLVCLEEITQHELKFASAEVASDAIETMTRVRDNERAREGHGRRRALISRAKKILRSTRGSRKIEDHAPERQTRSVGVEAATSNESPVVIKHFSKEVWHVVIVLALMVNAFIVALFVQCIAFQLEDVYEKSGIAMIVVLVLPAIVNVAFLQPKITWGFTLVSSVVRVDVTTLSEVIDHFVETVELRSQLVELILGHLDDTGKAIGALRTALLAEDPQKTGLIDVDDLRDLLGDFGVQLSFFRFNSVARLVFDLEGTMVPYDQLICLLEIAQMSGFDLGAPSESEESFHLLPLRSTATTSVLQIPEDEEVDGLRHHEYISPHRSVTAHRRAPVPHARQSLLRSASHNQVLSLYRLHGPSHIIDESTPRSSTSAVAPRHGRYTLDVSSTVSRDGNQPGSTHHQFHRI